MQNAAKRDETFNAGTDLFTTGPKSSGFRQIRIDDDTKEFLNQLRGVYARYVGPIARVFIKEAVIGLSPKSIFVDSSIPQLIAYLEQHIETDVDRKAFRKKIEKLLNKPL